MHTPPELQILLPIHNEGESIAATVREIYEELSPIAQVEFLFVKTEVKTTQTSAPEPGKRDPCKIASERRPEGVFCGSRRHDRDPGAVSPRLIPTASAIPLKDFRKFWENRNRADVLIGWRVQRADTTLRRMMSRTFFAIWKSLFRAPIHDPSCPFILARRDVIENIARKMGAMREGFWWEFSARVSRSGYTIREFPVHHRNRAAGVTQVYRLGKLPGIGYKHFVALFQILRETRPNV